MASELPSMGLSSRTLDSFWWQIHWFPLWDT